MFLSKFLPRTAHANKFRNRLDIGIDWWKLHTTEADQFATCFKKLADKKPGCKARSSWKWNQGCGSGSSSRYPKFFAPAPERFGPINTKNQCVICTNGLLHKLCRLNRNSYFRLRLHSPA